MIAEPRSYTAELLFGSRDIRRLRLRRTTLRRLRRSVDARGGVIDASASASDGSEGDGEAASDTKRRTQRRLGFHATDTGHPGRVRPKQRDNRNKIQQKAWRNDHLSEK